ncbi:MAG TPA: GNAT family N-acetyltransferase [Clostridia bacterium]|nr:GNAT family N-acetyltransferase [Clostridia bacterium]
MIAYCESAPPLDDTLIGCRMQMLSTCYGAMPNALDWFMSDAGGVFCRFGNSLLLYGYVDADELFAFAEMLDIRRIEWAAKGVAPNFLPEGWTSRSYPALCQVGGTKLSLNTIETDVQLRRCFELLCQSDAQFAREADYLPWLSDMTRRRNAGRAEVFLLDDIAVACVTAKGHRSAYLSSVAVLPDKRGSGIGISLVRAVVARPTLSGMNIYTAAQSEQLTAFYKQAGFEAMPQRLIITEKRNPA